MVLLTIVTVVNAQHVNWVSMDKALELSAQSNKKIFIDLYTNWCSWCIKMENTTFNNPTIASYLNEHFIPVKFNAEERGEIEYNGQSYKYVKYGKRGYHQLAAELSKSLGKLSYPTIIFLDEHQQLIQPIPGFQDPENLEIIIHYIAGDHFKTQPFKTYQAGFNRKCQSKLTSEP